jgi:DNA-binding protein HU-beta
MNKAEFVELVQGQGGYKTKKEAEAAIDAVTEAITAALCKKETVSLVGFGSFETSILKGKSGTVPGTDRKYTTKDKVVPKFKAGKTLKDKVVAGEQ